MSGMRQESDRPSSGDQPDAVAACLPIEVWTQITTLLSLRECCMLASTCRALRGMRDLPCIKVVKGCASGEGTVPLAAWHACSSGMQSL